MDDYHTFPECLSGSVNAQHDAQHYFGCLRESEKQKYFETLSNDRKARLKKEVLRISRQRSAFETEDHKKKRLVDNFKLALEEWRSLIAKKENIREFRSDAVPKPIYSASESANIKFLASDSTQTSFETEFEAKVILFKNSQPYSDPTLDGSFPNQSIPIQALLKRNGNPNPLRSCPSPNLIRYFHFPANNMAWIEEAIACYYAEERSDRKEQDLNTENKVYQRDALSQASSERQRSEVQRVLSTEIWRGQQHGKRSDPVHARFMRPRCSTIPKDRLFPQVPSTDDIVLFLPYLHWETDAGRLKRSELIKEEKYERFGVPKYSLATEVHDFSRVALLHSNSTEDMASMYIPLPYLQSTQRSVLGRFLLMAAKLADAMNDDMDEKLLRYNLFRDPPLHTRRTLDQHFYWTLKDTERQDTSQVIYRSTRATEKHASTCGIDCKGCQDLIRKIPRVIMVDQLWLWILDETTVITSFPKRWGRQLYDPSDIHESICDRLQTIGTRNEIHSARDLALIIIDQCCGTFFNQTWTTTTRDLQPQLTELFASSISNITYKRLRAYDNFLDYIQLRSRSSRSGMHSMARHWGMLNLNKEVVLLQESKDILSELKIIANIKQEQLQVVKSFTRHMYDMIQSSDATQGKYLWKLRRRCDALVESIQDHIVELKRLEEHAGDASVAINELLTLKQQQMGVVEAVEEAKIAGIRGDIALRQGRSILLFTIVTIVFLPLSFTASIFGMNSKEFNDGNITLGEEFKYMFTISLAIILATVIAAIWLYGVSIPEKLRQLYWHWWGPKRAQSRLHTYAVNVTVN